MQGFVQYQIKIPCYSSALRGISSNDLEGIAIDYCLDQVGLLPSLQDSVMIGVSGPSPQ